MYWRILNIVSFFDVLVCNIRYENGRCFIGIVFGYVIVLVNDYWVMDWFYVDVVKCYVWDWIRIILLCFDLNFVVGIFYDGVFYSYVWYVCVWVVVV